MSESKHYISIWFFIGSLLLIYGVLITGAELYAINHPPAQQVVLSELRIGVWWGLLLVLIGLIYVAKFRPRKD